MARADSGTKADRAGECCSPQMSGAEVVFGHVGGGARPPSAARTDQLALCAFSVMIDPRSISGKPASVFRSSI